MKASCKQNGFSLTEMVVVVAIIALLTALGLPAINSLRRSFESGSGAKSMISAALSSARAIAAKEQRYAGVRFELDFHDNQYMIFIIHDPESTGLSNGFRALEGQKPIKLPEDSRVIDMKCRADTNPETLRDDSLEAYGSIGQDYILHDDLLQEYPDGQNSRTLRDTSCFSIIFSPTGKLAMHEVRVRNRDGIYKPDNSVPGKVSMDDIFNSPENILNYNVGMFLQDDDWSSEYTWPRGSFGTERGRNKFFIYEKSYFDKIEDSEERLEYLLRLEPVFINQYTGTIIDSKK